MQVRRYGQAFRWGALRSLDYGKQGEGGKTPSVAAVCGAVCGAVWRAVWCDTDYPSPSSLSVLLAGALCAHWTTEKRPR